MKIAKVVLRGFISTDDIDGSPVGEALPIHDPHLAANIVASLDFNDIAFRANDDKGKEILFIALPQQYAKLEILSPSIKQYHVDEWFVAITCL